MLPYPLILFLLGIQPEVWASSAKYMAAGWDPALHSIELLHILRPCGNSRYKPLVGFFIRILVGKSLV